METRESVFKGPLVVAAAVGGLALIIAALIGSMTLYRIRSFDNTLVVTGSAKTSVVSDSVKWQSTISRTVSESGLQTGHAQIARDAAIVQEILVKKGINAGEIAISPVFTEQVYSYERNAGAPREYSLRQTITVSSSNIDAVTAVTKNTQDIAARGVIFSTQSPEYYYSKLAELRVSLLADAIKDAKARALQIAGSNDQDVGPLKSAASGVVQVLAPNSIDVSDYGQYDTSSVAKDIMITVRATFMLD